MVTNATSADPAGTSAWVDETTQGSNARSHFWVVRCVRPKGASTHLAEFIQDCETAIQRAVDLLGRRAPTLPPRVAGLLQPRAHQDPGDGAGIDSYLRTLTPLETQRSSLLSMDQQVATTTVAVAAGQDQTLRNIQKDVADLNAKLQAAESSLVGARTVQSRAPLETALMAEIGATVQKVCQRVSSAYQLNAQLAGDPNKRGGQGPLSNVQVPAGGATGAGTGGGPDMLSSLLPLLAMIPMAAAPLLSMVPELLKQHTSENPEEGKKDGKKTDPERTGAPAAADANAPQPVVSAAPSTTSAPPSDQSSDTKPSTLPGVRA